MEEHCRVTAVAEHTALILRVAGAAGKAISIAVVSFFVFISLLVVLNQYLVFLLICCGL